MDPSQSGVLVVEGLDGPWRHPRGERVDHEGVAYLQSCETLSQTDINGSDTLGKQLLCAFGSHQAFE
jgi:hypothetical protein